MHCIEWLRFAKVSVSPSCEKEMPIDMRRLKSGEERGDRRV